MVNFRESPNQGRTHRLVETGVLLGLTMVLILLSILFPIVGGFAMFVQPSILYLIITRSGLRWAIMVTIASIILAVILAGPIKAINVALMELLPALGFSLFLHYRLRIGWILFGTTLSYFSGLICWLVVSMLFFGISLSPEALEAQMHASIHTGFFAQISTPDKIREMQEMIPMMIRLVYGILAVGFLFLSAASAAVNYKITQYFSRRFAKIELPGFPPFSNWDFPKWMGMPVLIVAICNIYLQYRGLILPDWLSNVFFFFLYVSGLMMIFQGFAVLKSMLDRYQAPRMLFYLFVGMLFVFPAIGTITMFIGVADLFLNYRRLPRL